MSEKVRWYKRILPFLRDVRAELRKVTWPSRSEVVNTTIVVIASIIFFGFFLFFMDILFSWLITRLKGVLG